MTDADAASPTVVLPVAGRFAQLTYTSFHRDGGSGGWQVKDVRGEVSAAERQALIGRISTRLAPATRLPTLPTSEERAVLPRRLVYGETVDGAHAFWHTIPAGTDSSGRPGNVFAHVVLDRRPLDADPPLRSSDLMSAPQWLQPYGAGEVLASSLDEVADPPWSSGPMSAEAVLPFLVDDAMVKAAVLAALLDAVAAALAGGPRVVLGVGEPGHAEPWIAGVLHLMSPATGRRLFWSTAEKGGEIALPLPVHLAVVPRADLDALDALDAAEVVLLADDPESVELGDLEEGQPHHSCWGSAVPVTRWSVLAQEVLQDVDLAKRTLATADRVAAGIGDRGLPPSWPLAMAATFEAHELPDVQSEARQVLAGTRPEGLAHAPELDRQHRAALLGSLGPSTAEAWQATTGEVPGVDPGLAATVYLERALQDDEWLLRPEGVPLPAARAARGDQWARAVDDALARVVRGGVVPGAPDERAVRLVRLVDLVARANVLDLSDAGPVTSTLRAGLDDVLGPCLADVGGGGRVAAGVGPIDDAVVTDVLLPWLDRSLSSTPGVPGHRVAPALLAWLHPVPPAPPAPTDLGSARVSSVLVELAAQVTAVVAHPSAFRALALDQALRRQAAGEERSGVLRLTQGPAFTAAELRYLAREHGVHQLAAALPPVLGTAPDDDDLENLVDQVRDTVPEDAEGVLRAARRLADLRFHAAAPPALDRPGDRAAVVEVLRTAEDLLVDLAVAPSLPVLRVVIVALLVDLVEVLLERVPATGHPPRQAVTVWLERHSASLVGQEDRVRDDLERLLEHRVVSDVDLGAAAIVAAVRCAEPDRLPAARRWASLVAVGRRPSVVDDLLAGRLGRHDPEATETFLVDVYGAVTTVVDDRPPRDVDRMMRERWRLTAPPPTRPRRPWSGWA